MQKEEWGGSEMGSCHVVLFRSLCGKVCEGHVVLFNLAEEVTLSGRLGDHQGGEYARYHHYRICQN